MSYKVSKAIEVSYQAAGAVSGLSDVQMDVYDEAHAIDAPKGGFMVEIGSTGRYWKVFTPDAEGEWTVLIDSASTPGKIVKKFTVVAHDVDSVGDDVATLDGKVALDTTVAKEATVAKAADVALDATVAKDTTVAKEASLAPLAQDSTVSKEATAAKDATVSKETTTAAVKAKTDNLPASPAASGEATTAEGNIRGGTETLESLKTAVDAQSTPPMVG